MTFITKHAIFVSFVMPASLSFVFEIYFSFSLIVYEILILLLLVHTHVRRISHLIRLSRLPHHLHVGHIHLPGWGLHHVHIHVHLHRDTTRHGHAAVHLILIVHSLRLI